MASPRKPPSRGAGASLEACVAEARAGSPAPVYLFDGDAFLATRAAREIAAALVPEAQRALNVVELDAAAAPAEVAAELATRGLFSGAESRKVVIAVEPAFLASKEDAAGAFARAQEMWERGRQREAARRLLALAAKAGWSAQDLSGDGAPDADAWQKALAVELAAPSAEFVRAAAAFAVEREMKAAKDDASALDALLAQGLPPGHVLLVAAGKVDGRLPLVKRLAAAGRRVAVGIEREWVRGQEHVLLRPILDALLAGTAKRADAAAERRLTELVGDDARALASEVAKLVAYVGERKTIGAADVDAVVTRVAADPFFALGNAVEARDLPLALAVLDRSLADGAHPILVLATLASTVRRLVLERERGRRIVGERRLTAFMQWEDLILPHMAPGELGDRKPFGFWKKYEAAQRYPRAALLGALADLAEADLAMKSGGDERPLLERILWRLMADADGSAAAPRKMEITR